jgi:hypothetical protein
MFALCTIPTPGGYVRSTYSVNVRASDHYGVRRKFEEEEVEEELAVCGAIRLAIYPFGDI